MEPGGQLNIQQLLEQAQKMQAQLAAAQQALAGTEVTGTAGGGLVSATVNGQGEVVAVTIAPEAIDTDDAAETAETVADLVLAAIRDAGRAAADAQRERLGPLASGITGGGFPGLPAMPEMPDFSDLAGLMGLPGVPPMPPGFGTRPGAPQQPGKEAGDTDEAAPEKAVPADQPDTEKAKPADRTADRSSDSAKDPSSPDE